MSWWLGVFSYLVLAVSLQSSVANAASLIVIEPQMFASSPPVPVEKPILSIEDVDALRRISCVVTAGAAIRTKFDLLDTRKNPQEIGGILLDKHALQALAWTLEPPVSGEPNGVWLTDSAFQKLAMNPNQPLPKMLVQQIQPLAAPGTAGASAITRPVALQGRAANVFAIPLISTATLAISVEAILFSADTRFSGGERSLQAVPPMLFLRSRGDPSACVASVMPMTEAWSQRSGLKFRVRTIPH
jgi:hypothetical protein